MVLVGEAEPVVSDRDDELADADIISSGGEGSAVVEHLARTIRSRRARIIAVPVLAAAVTAVALLVPGSHPASPPAAPSQQVAGVIGPQGWAGPAGCHRGRSCPRG
jgi:hypothetical protein